jgi:hypothetical protein
MAGGPREQSPLRAWFRSSLEVPRSNHVAKPVDGFRAWVFITGALMVSW